MTVLPFHPQRSSWYPNWHPEHHYCDAGVRALTVVWLNSAQGSATILSTVPMWSPQLSPWTSKGKSWTWMTLGPWAWRGGVLSCNSSLAKHFLHKCKRSLHGWVLEQLTECTASKKIPRPQTGHVSCWSLKCMERPQHYEQGPGWTEDFLPIYLDLMLFCFPKHKIEEEAQKCMTPLWS